MKDSHARGPSRERRNRVNEFRSLKAKFGALHDEELGAPRNDSQIYNLECFMGLFPPTSGRGADCSRSRGAGT